MCQSLEVHSTEKGVSTTKSRTLGELGMVGRLGAKPEWGFEWRARWGGRRGVSRRLVRGRASEAALIGEAFTLGQLPIATGFRRWQQETFIQVCAASKRSQRRTIAWLEDLESKRLGGVSGLQAKVG